MSLVQHVTGLLVCGLAGFAGALASVFGKIAGFPDVDLPVRLACYLLLVVCNGLMLVLYTRALRRTSSLSATAATMSMNIFATGQVGRCVWGGGGGGGRVRDRAARRPPLAHLLHS